MTEHVKSFLKIARNVTHPVSNSIGGFWQDIDTLKGDTGCLNAFISWYETTLEPKRK